MGNQKIIIAIDGYSSTGKSTVARRIARHLGYVYVDTGAMYRAVTFFGLEQGWIGDAVFETQKIVDGLDQVHIHFEVSPSSGLAEVVLNGTIIEDRIRSLRVSSFVSAVAAISEVRQKLVQQQQCLGASKGVVMDGRDIGTVVFPNAELKLFMTATAEDRAYRRYKELLERGEMVDYQEVLRNVQQRDHTDSTREDSPLRKTDDAIVIDNSKMDLEEQFRHILSLVHKVFSAL